MWSFDLILVDINCYFCRISWVVTLFPRRQEPFGQLYVCWVEPCWVRMRVELCWVQTCWVWYVFYGVDWVQSCWLDFGNVWFRAIEMSRAEFEWDDIVWLSFRVDWIGLISNELDWDEFRWVKLRVFWMS